MQSIYHVEADSPQGNDDMQGSRLQSGIRGWKPTSCYTIVCTAWETDAESFVSMYTILVIFLLSSEFLAQASTSTPKREDLRTASTVKQSVSRLDGLVDLIGARLVVYLPQPKAHLGHLVAIVKLDARDRHDVSFASDDG